jgi:uncharacterized repeat protein (TIGR04138 family)
MDDVPEKMLRIIEGDGRYPVDAYKFLHEGLEWAVRKRHGSREGSEESFHVTGEEICQGLRDLAINRWGMLARTVLAKWGIGASIDFGNMVYLLINEGVWNKTADDSIEDFRDVFDFETAFDDAGEFELTG